MDNILDITGKDVEKLNDTDLRTLIGLLCEAEATQMGLQTAGVTWGGDQTASDGGIDVRVKLPVEPPSETYIPRTHTGFQVKSSDLARAAIIKEMKPKGKLRSSIKELVEIKGAYIIISSKSTTTDSTFQNRIMAMQEALKGLINKKNIKVDYYDQGRIASWVRTHPSIVLWLRDIIGRPIQGWKPYGNWARCPEGIESEYISDDELHFYNSTSMNGEGSTVIEGIQMLREKLNRPASSLRLTGLSGVGKTRFLQALFDDRVGENPLNKSLVLYTDISDNPNPDPRHFAEQLIAFKKNVILAVDNCNPELHRGLTNLCTASGSLVSLITVEYDIKDDQPEETEVFRLEPVSVNLIEKIINTRFNFINQVDARTIAEYSGGNAKIAIALANTVKYGENLGKLKDNDLFNRLFYQRNEPDKNLLKAAEVCSLVYSFECNTQEGHEIELQLLSSLADMSVKELYKQIIELLRRELIQKRGVWRAVLPHAIAIKLANNALENIPVSEIRSVFEKKSPARLLTSFSKRLSYLHENEHAREIVVAWFSEGGILADLSNLSPLGMDLLKNIAPISPILVVEAIEKAAVSDTSGKFLSRDNSFFIDLSRLLRKLAYDSELFTRSVNLLCKIALSENPKELNNSVRNQLKSLFKLILSGTHATAEQRLSIISKLMDSKLEAEIQLASSLLGESLKYGNFSSDHSFEFGARPRNIGYRPKNIDEIKHWYKLFIDFAAGHASSGASSAILTKILLANRFRELWTLVGMDDELEDSVERIIKRGTWKEGWIAVKKTLRFDKDRLGPESVSRLKLLADRLQPSTLIERARMYAFYSDNYNFRVIDALGDDESSYNISTVEETTRLIGREVTSNPDVLNELVGELLSSQSSSLYSFGKGMAEGCNDPVEIWNILKKNLKIIDIDNRNYQLLKGFLSGTSNNNSAIANRLLDEALNDEALSTAFPILQTSVVLDSKAFKRIIYALENDIAPIWRYNSLASIQVLSALTDNALIKIVKLIFSKHGGEIVALKILLMRLSGKFGYKGLPKNQEDKVDVSSALESFCQKILRNFDYSRVNKLSDNIDYEIGSLIEYCFVKESAYSSALQICKKLSTGFSKNEIEISYFSHVLNSLATTQPLAFLDGFFGPNREKDHQFTRGFPGEIRVVTNPMSAIADDVIINWCEKNPKIRYHKIASEIMPFFYNELENRMAWTSLAMCLLNNSPNPIMILEEYKTTFIPMSWSNSRSSIMQKCMVLFNFLKNHEDSKIVEWAMKKEIEFENRILDERKWENIRVVELDERFE